MKTAKLHAGQTFKMGTIECVVSAVDAFGCTPHYGFTYQDAAGQFQSGWCPVEFVDNAPDMAKMIEAAALEVVYGDLLPKYKFQLPTSAQVAEVITRNLKIHKAVMGENPARRAIEDALDRIQKMEFNGRDYYPVAGSFEKARDERMVHLTALRAASEYFLAIAEHCSDAVAERDARRNPAPVVPMTAAEHNTFPKGRW